MSWRLHGTSQYVTLLPFSLPMQRTTPDRKACTVMPELGERLRICQLCSVTHALLHLLSSARLEPQGAIISIGLRASRVHGDDDAKAHNCS